MGNLSKTVWPAVAKYLEVRTHRTVQTGPFQGLDYPPGFGDLPWNRILGTYELELFESIENAISRLPSRILNIGGGEGFYIVGLLRRLPDAHGVVFEMDDCQRSRIEKLAKANGVADRLEVHGLATPDNIADFIDTSTLIVIDVEGAEKMLLDSDKIPNLKDASILVELHDYADNQITPTLLSRFKDSHNINILSSRERSIEDIKPLCLSEKKLLKRMLVASIGEGRADVMYWWWMTPKSSQ